jgi:hypothetical protein
MVAFVRRRHARVLLILLGVMATLSASCVQSETLLRSAPIEEAGSAPTEDASTRDVEDECAHDACASLPDAAEAATKDVAVDAEEDAFVGGPCGGIAGLLCKSGEYCDYVNCGLADELGTCVKKPAPCTPPVGCPNQVCGCDGVTYCDVCESSAAAVDVKSNGPC